MDFMFWLVSLESLSPKRRWAFWLQGEALSDKERDKWVLKLIGDNKLNGVSKMIINRLKSLPHINWYDDDYPDLLREIAQPPLVLFYRGDRQLLQRNKVAIVGSRKMSAYGQALVVDWIPKLVSNDFVTVSGIAAGVDGCVHAETLLNAGQTIGVIGHGFDFVYPPQHRVLFRHIEQYGLVLSEYVPWVSPKRWRFPERNRIIVGLTANVWVVEAEQKSGSLVSAAIAADENRQIWCVPRNVTDPRGQGTNQLLCDGANIAINGDDFLTGLTLT
ncbi:DNA protecting protein DprA [Weissella ceti NC36]|nr:DNA protecting protein DprA [Weissella ceti NC36]